MATTLFNPAIVAALRTSPPVTAAITPAVVPSPIAPATILPKVPFPKKSLTDFVIKPEASKLTPKACPIEGNIGVSPAVATSIRLPPLSAVTATRDITVAVSLLRPNPAGPNTAVSATVSRIGNALSITTSAIVPITSTTPPIMSPTNPHII